MAPTKRGGLRSGGVRLYENPIPNSGVSRWTFDSAHTVAGTAIDIWGSNDGAINGATPGATGARQTYNTNEAYSFDNSGSPDDNVDCGSASSLDLTDEFSWSLWAYADSYNNPDAPSDILRLLAKRDGDINTGPELFVDDDDSPHVLRFIDGDVSTDFEGATEVPTGVYYMVTVTFSVSNDVAKIYYNGSIDGQQTGISPLSSHSGVELRVGCRPKTENFGWDGRIDDVRVYNKALTSAEVSNLYNTGSI